MSIHFKSLRLQDWLVYGGEAEITFPNFDDGRNLVVINGQNGFGKTSLLQAMSFVFNGRANKSELLELWNEHARYTKEGSVEVGIEFTHGGCVCKIVRGADFKPRRNVISVIPWVKLFIDGKEKTEQVEDKIEQFLPHDCLEFLFFDGAEISRYARKQHESGVRDAIEKVLGIPAVRNLRDDLTKVVSELEDEQEQLLSQSHQAEDLLSEIEELKEEEENYLVRRREHVEKKQSLASTKAELEKEAEGIEAIEHQRQELKNKEHRHADLRDRRDELNAHVQQIVSQTPLAMLETPLRQVVEELRAKQQPSSRREGHSARLTVLKELVDQDECLCGQNVDESVLKRFNAEVDRIEKLLEGMPARGAGVSNELLDLATLLKTVESLVSNPESLIDKRAVVDTQLEELETDIYRLKGELEGHESARVYELFQQIGQFTEQLTEFEITIDSIDKNLDGEKGTRSRLQQAERERDKIAAGDELARGVTRILDESRRVLAAVSEMVEQIVERKREAIQSSATDVFRQITNKPDEYDCLRVNHDYSLEVVRKDDSVVENTKLSAGEKEVVAYSFITALNLSSVNPAPFVMDTPFGHLDSGHRAGLLRSLPKLKVQAILLATDRDLPAGERDAIDGSIAKEFTLVRDQRQAITTIEDN